MSAKPRNQFARVLRAARQAKGVSQEGFGDVSGRTYVSQLERGERNATLAKIDDLASVLGVHPASLVVSAYLPPAMGQAAVDTLLARIRRELLSLAQPGRRGG